MMKIAQKLAFVGLAGVIGTAHAQSGPRLPYTAQTPAHGELGKSQGTAAQLADEATSRPWPGWFITGPIRRST
jgi:hypothetical protein